MSEVFRNPLKATLRKTIESSISKLTRDEIVEQSRQITQKVLSI